MREKTQSEADSRSLSRALDVYRRTTPEAANERRQSEYLEGRGDWKVEQGGNWKRQGSESMKDPEIQRYIRRRKKGAKYA